MSFRVSKARDERRFDSPISLLALSGLAPVILGLLVVLAVSISRSPAETVRLEVIGDTSIAAYKDEVTHNLGGSSHIRIKGIQHFMLMKFDLMPVRGQTVSKAVLHLRSASKQLWLRTVGLSTIATEWEEGSGHGQPVPGMVCFQYAAYPDRLWAGPQSDFTDVTFGAGNTLCAYTDIKLAADGWLEIDVPPELVQAMICGDSYGLVVSDEKGQTMANNDVYSREQTASRPYMTVEATHNDSEPPTPPADLAVEPLPERAHLDSGAMRISLRAPSDAGPTGRAFTYEGELVTASGETIPIPRHFIPHATDPGEVQQIIMTDLPPDTTWTVRLHAVDGAGNRSDWVSAKGRSSPALPWPKIGSTPVRPVSTTSARRAQSPVWVCPALAKVNPANGNVLEEVGSDAYGGEPTGTYAGHNPVWDGSTVRLLAGHKQFASFQIIVQPRNLPAQATLRIGHFTCAEGPTLGPKNVEIFREWYIKDGKDWYPEVALPMTDTIQVPAPDNQVPNQRNQAVWVDLYVPAEAAVGQHTAEIEVSVAGESVRLPLVLEVLQPETPDELNFNIDLNGYGPVGSHFGLDNRSAEYRAVEREYHRMAHRHRGTLDLLGYSHSGNISANYAPPIEGRGANLRITDWSSWDEQFGPYLSGEAFADLPRGPVPVHNMYLWLHEDWPAHIKEHYDAPPVSNEYPLMIMEHAMRAKPIEEAFDEEYAQAFRAAARQIAEHFAERGWTRTDFQCYFNNKHYYKDPKRGGRGTSWWLLDEPNWRDDWLALEYFSRLFKEGIRGIAGPRMIYREDLSRPQWQRQWLRDTVDLMVISSELFRKNRRCLDLQRETGGTIWNYGTGNAIRVSNIEAIRWALRAYLAGADAVVPWNTIGHDGDYEKPDPTAILYPGKRFGIPGPIASLRLKAFRQAAQDVESLILLAKKRGWRREQVAAAVAMVRGKDLPPQQLAVEPWTAIDDLSVDELQGLRLWVLKQLSA